MKEYVVVAHNEPAIDSLHNDLTRDTGDDLHVDRDVIPTRTVDVANFRLGNPRITHYYLTDQEAEALVNDPRVENINLVPNPSALKKTVIQKPSANNYRLGNFNRNSLRDKYNVNWGLRRTSVTATEQSPGNFYEYNNDGSGVDIIIVDDGITINHPEFLDNSGLTRVQTIDWYKETGIPGVMPIDHYNPISPGSFEHGTHVASIAAGKTFGYAKNSRIYSIRIFGNDNETIDINDVFDLVRVWHSKKPVDPTVGIKRPTICNLSWIYAWEFPRKAIDRIAYRNTIRDYPRGTDKIPSLGQHGRMHGMSIPSLDAELQAAEDVGVIFVQSAGNCSQKIDVPSGSDYNNYYTTQSLWGGMIPAGKPIYYNRGSSPYSQNLIRVSAAKDITKRINSKLYEQIDSYSDRGPGCSILAPGTNITAATSPQSQYRKNEYVWGGPGQKSNHWTTKQSGTSMAAPQVTGVLALYLSQNPTATPAQAKSWIQQISLKDQIWTTNGVSDYSNPNSLLGGSNQYLYNPFRRNYKI